MEALKTAHALWGSWTQNFGVMHVDSQSVEQAGSSSHVGGNILERAPQGWELRDESATLRGPREAAKHQDVSACELSHEVCSALEGGCGGHRSDNRASQLEGSGSKPGPTTHLLSDLQQRGPSTISASADRLPNGDSEAHLLLSL